MVNYKEVILTKYRGSRWGIFIRSNYILIMLRFQTILNF